jgi:hypothetical protein
MGAFEITAPTSNGSGRSHEKTLLAKLGGSDEDRRHPLHDLACQYISQSKVAVKLANLLDLKALWAEAFIDPPPCRESKSYQRREECDFGFRYSDCVFSVTDTRSHQECLLTKGDGQYATTIGFVDVLIHYSLDVDVHRTATYFECDSSQCPEFWPQRPKVIRHGCVRHRCCDHAKETTITKHVNQRVGGRSIGVEVKAGKVPVAEAIRQVKLYGQHCKMSKWVLATPWELSSFDKATLDNEGIKHVLLGEDFARFTEAARRAPAAESDMVL